MKKKWICTLAVILILLAGGKIAFDKGRDYVTKKMVTELADTEEVKKYKEEAEKAAAEVAGGEGETEEATEKEEEKKPEEKKAENPPAAQDFWSEPLVREVYARFSASEISTCSSMLSGGLTKEEKKYIKNLVYSRVSSAEISEIERLYYKYN